MNTILRSLSYVVAFAPVSILLGFWLTGFYEANRGVTRREHEVAACRSVLRLFYAVSLLAVLLSLVRLR